MNLVLFAECCRLKNGRSVNKYFYLHPFNIQPALVNINRWLGYQKIA